MSSMFKVTLFFILFILQGSAIAQEDPLTEAVLDKNIYEEVGENHIHQKKEETLDKAIEKIKADDIRNFKEAIAKEAVKEDDIIDEVKELNGKIIEYNYGEDIYRIEFKEGGRLKWECVAGEEKGRAAFEEYVITKINDQSFFISWVEEEGTIVSQIIDLEEMKVNTYFVISENIIPIKGTLKFVE